MVLVVVDLVGLERWVVVERPCRWVVVLRCGVAFVASDLASLLHEVANVAIPNVTKVATTAIEPVGVRRGTRGGASPFVWRTWGLHLTEAPSGARARRSVVRGER